ncbi:MAG: 3-deoxy-D-manno-octulosonic acid transferase [Paracoccaceae bacterium]
MPEAEKTGLYRGYGWVTRLVLPLAYRRVSRKLAQSGVPDARIRERLGHATQSKPDGYLVWFHAASVGESLSVLSLIERLGILRPDLAFLITSGTATSAQLIEQRMPPRCRHQFAPLDAAAPLDRFLRHWQPKAAIIVESELWPQTLVRTYETGARLALVNARLSRKSLDGWSRRPKTAKALLDLFSVIMTQNSKMADALITLGADPDRVKPGANLKATSAPLPVDTKLVAEMRADLGPRTVWVAASTHLGEEETVLAAHQELLETDSDLCLILAPRHPERGSEIEAMIIAMGLSVACRSKGGLPGTAQVYLADTLGELGSWYALAPFVFLGGSLLPIGGHNPYEVAQVGVPVLSGSHVTNFAETFADLGKFGGWQTVSAATDLSQHAKLWLDDAAALKRACDGARAFMSAQQQGLENIAQTLLDALLPKD